MSAHLHDAKAALRQECLRRRQALSDAARQAADARIRETLADLPELQAAPSLAAFHPTVGEPDLRPLLARLAERGKTCYFPQGDADGTYRLAPLPSTPVHTFADCFRPGRFGIPEPGTAPVSPAEAAPSLWLIPGVAFDPSGRRLGRGGGVYDRLLRGATGLRIAVAYETQITPAVPAGPDDQAVHRIVTETGIRRCPTPPIPERN